MNQTAARDPEVIQDQREILLLKLSLIARCDEMRKDAPDGEMLLIALEARASFRNDAGHYLGKLGGLAEVW